jgi:hypothetical protein
MLTLEELDQSFDQLWLNTAQLPALLTKWQELVSEYLAELEPSAQKLIAFEEKMSRWQTILEENRSLLEGYQQTLKNEIVEGQPNPQSAEKAKRFQG